MFTAPTRDKTSHFLQYMSLTFQVTELKYRKKVRTRSVSNQFRVSIFVLKCPSLELYNKEGQSNFKTTLTEWQRKKTCNKNWKGDTNIIFDRNYIRIGLGFNRRGASLPLILQNNWNSGYNLGKSLIMQSTCQNNVHLQFLTREDNVFKMPYSIHPTDSKPKTFYWIHNNNR